MSWIRKALGLCEHRWKTFASFNVNSSGSTVAVEYHMRCEKCGDIKKVRT